MLADNAGIYKINVSGIRAVFSIEVWLLTVRSGEVDEIGVMSTVVAGDSEIRVSALMDRLLNCAAVGDSTRLARMEQRNRRL